MAMLILHPDEGPILFDTGYDPAFLAATKPFPERLYRWATPVEIPQGRDAASQCRSMGVDPAEVRHVVLSHFHGDHVAGLHAFPGAAVHCASAGLKDVRQGSRFSTTRRGLLPALLPADIAIRALFRRWLAGGTSFRLRAFRNGRRSAGRRLPAGRGLARPLPGALGFAPQRCAVGIAFPRRRRGMVD
jgi:glyoxylase-like metal-dependent hydrolase (beta-lactamase superfamily II)